MPPAKGEKNRGQKRLNLIKAPLREVKRETVQHHLSFLSENLPRKFL